MAKPLPVASSGAPGTSKSTIVRRQHIPEHPYPSRHRRNPSPKSPSSLFAPSSGLLVLLASVASASTVSGSPAPPSFLCPSIDSEDTVDAPRERRALPSSSVTVTPTPSAAYNILLPRHVPDQYRQGPDGIWRRLGTYTLYGSTVSACDGICRQPTNAVSAVDDQIQVSGNTNKSDSTTYDQLDDIRDSLPPGWKPTRTSENRTPLILAVSLVLAFLICSFIIGCLFWRKTVKKNHRSYDVEAKARRKRSAISVESLVAEKEHKTKQKIWARATARWKANVRYTARQRRGRRFGSRASIANQSTLSLDRSRSRLAGSNSSIRSTASSRRSSTSSIRSQLHDEDAIPTSPTSAQVSNSRPSSPAQPTINNPPAYQHRSQIPPIIISSDDPTGGEYPTSTPQFGRSRRPSHSSNYSASAAITNDGHVVELSPTHLHAAHVATDDKSLLARLQDLASAPPTDDSLPSAGTSEIQVSAPEWQDDDIEAFAPELTTSPGQSSTSPSMFPPPPSKGVLAASEFYTHPYSFEEMEDLDAECGPSAPPFEEGASPPLQDTHLLVPSAPPLLGEDDHIHDMCPSAPEWDDSSPALDSCEECIAGQDHDRIPTELTAPHPSEPPPPRAPTPSIGSSTPHPTANDNIALPGYRP
uniref:Uncharacterized protein n=1 Tax=Psilocybe cubensis TaxID=181762 RepID=A0A8H7Y6P3_PSICU